MQKDIFVYDYPIVDMHSGCMLCNGMLGLLVWGEGNVIKLTVGHGSLFENQAGFAWTPLMNFVEDKAKVFAAGPEEAAKILEGRKIKGQLARAGRIEFTLKEGCHLLRNELSRIDGCLRAYYFDGSAEKFAEVRLDMINQGSFALNCEDVVDCRVLSLHDLAAEVPSFVQALELKRDDLCGFIQPLPSNPAYGIAVCREGSLFTCNCRRSRSVAQLKADLQGEGSEDWENVSAMQEMALHQMLPGLTSLDWGKLVRNNQEWWGRYWEEHPFEVVERCNVATCLIYAAGGTSRRYGANKLLATLDGKPVFMHSLARLAPMVTYCLLIVPKSDIEMYEMMVSDEGLKNVRVLPAEETRGESVASVLSELPEDVEIVAIQDAARPFTSKELLSSCLSSAEEYGSGVAAHKVVDTLKVATPEGIVIASVDREPLWSVETPQAFRKEWLVDAYSKANGVIVDDSRAVAAAGYAVRLVEHQSYNGKITKREDLAMADALLGDGK